MMMANLAGAVQTDSKSAKQAIKKLILAGAATAAKANECSDFFDGTDFIIPAATTGAVECRDLTNIPGDLIAEGTGVSNIDLRRVTSVGGNLIYKDNAQLGQAYLEDMQNVGGNFVFDNNDKCCNEQPDDVTLDTRALETVGGDYVLSNNDGLDRVSGNSLESVGGDLIMDNNGATRILAVPTLESVGGDIKVTNNPELLESNFGGVTSAENVEISGNNEMNRGDLGRLTNIGDFILSNNPKFRFMNIPVLKTVGNDFTIESNDVGAANGIFDSAQLETIGGNFNFKDNNAVTCYGRFIKNVGGQINYDDNDKNGNRLFFDVLEPGNKINARRNKALNYIQLPASLNNETLGEFSGNDGAGCSVWFGNVQNLNAC